MSYIFKPPTAIIYSKEFEPICHIPMASDIYKYFLEYDIVKFPVSKPLNPTMVTITEGSPIIDNVIHAEISAMRIHSSDGIRLLLISRNDETTLLMRNTFLPGQTKELNLVKQQYFYTGMAAAIKALKK